MAVTLSKQSLLGQWLGPFTEATAVTPHDTNDLTVPCRALFIGVAGNVKVDMVGVGAAVVFTAMAIGIHQIAVTRVYSTGTAATNIVALY